MTKKNFIQTIKSYNPQRLFTFSDINSFIEYDGKNIVGSIFDEDTSATLVPKLTYLKNPPKSINLFGPSVIANELENQSLSISGTNLLYPYNVSYKSESPSFKKSDNDTFIVQFKSPTQSLSSQTIIDKHSVPYAYITIDSGEVIFVESILYGRYWYLPITEQIDFDVVKSFDIEVFYKSQLFYADTYHVELDEYLDRFDSMNEFLKFPSDDSKAPLFDSIMPDLPFSVSGAKAEWYSSYGQHNSSPVFYVTDDDRKIIYGKGLVVFYGVIHERIDIANFKAGEIDSYKTTIVDVGNIKVSSYNTGKKLYIDIEYNLVNSMNVSRRIYEIKYDTGYTLAITQESVQITNKPAKRIRFYLNGKSLFVTDSTDTINFTSSDIMIGIQQDNIRSIAKVDGYFNFWQTMMLIYNNNGMTTFIDNVCVIDKVLSEREIYLLYIRTMTYKQLLLSFNPYFHIEFNEPKSSYTNLYDTEMIDVHDFEVTSKTISSEVYDIGVNFAGRGSLLHKYKNTNQTSTTSLINFNTSFSLVFWFNTSTRNFLLYSERNKSNPKNGLSIFVEDGYITYHHENVKHRTTCFVADDKFRMLCIAYNGTSLETFVPGEHTSKYNVILQSNNIFPRYVTLLNDKSTFSDVNITLSAFTVFSNALSSLQFNDLYNENITYSITGRVLFSNLPAYSQVRIIDHATGELVDVKYTDSKGDFKYTSIYRNALDIVTMNNGRLQVIGTLKSTTR